MQYSLSKEDIAKIEAALARKGVAAAEVKVEHGEVVVLQVERHKVN